MGGTGSVGEKVERQRQQGKPRAREDSVCGPGSTLLRWNGFQGVVGWLTENSKVRRVKIDPECTWGGMGSVGLPVKLSEDFDGVAEEGGSNTKPEFSVFPHPPPPSRACKGIFSWCCPCRVFLSRKELSVLHSFSLGVLSSTAEGPAPGRELLSCL